MLLVLGRGGGLGLFRDVCDGFVSDSRRAVGFTAFITGPRPTNSYSCSTDKKFCKQGLTVNIGVLLIR